MKPVTEQDWVKALSRVEEERDVVAMNQAQKEYSEQFAEFNEDKVKFVNFHFFFQILISFFVRIFLINQKKKQKKKQNLILLNLL